MDFKQLLIGEVKAIESDDPNGSFEVVLSAPTLDRDGEIIDARAFEPLPDHITFDIDHGLSVATTVGSGVPRYDGDVLKVSGVFSSISRAQEVRTLVEEGHIRTTSVAFMAPKRTVKDGTPHITSAELLNGAFVPVPSNREAVVLAAKSRGYVAEIAASKALAGSFEERREQLRDAVRTSTPDGWTWVVATFDDSVIYEVENGDGTSRWQATYEIDNAGAVTLGEATEVEIIEVVQPKAAEKPTSTVPEGAAPAANPPVNGAVAKALVDRVENDMALAEAEALLRT